jgi:uncharacterized membrane protein
MLAMYRLSHYYNEPGIFSNVLYAFIISLVGGIVALGIFFAFMLSAIGSISRTSTPSLITPFFSQLIIFYLIVIGMAFLFGIINGVLYMRAFNKLGQKSGVDSFKTAGLLYFLGVLLSIVGVGGILTWIAWIFAALGFRKLKAAPTPTSAYSAPQSTAPSITQTKLCPYCGTENIAEAIYCKNCGKPIQ